MTSGGARNETSRAHLAHRAHTTSAEVALPVRRLTVVLPIRNEAPNLAPMVETLLSQRIPGIELSVLLVENASTDGSTEIASALAQEHAGRVTALHVCKSGLGTAYVAGFQHALGMGADLIVQMDCDFSHPPEVIGSLVALLDAEEADLVLGSRWTAGGALDERWPWYRRLLSRFANDHYIRFALHLPLADATGGFRLWRRETLLGMDLMRIESHGYVFQVEMACLCHRLGYRMVELPITFGERRAGESKMSLSIQVEAAWRVLRIALAHRGLSMQHRARVEVFRPSHVASDDVDRVPRVQRSDPARGVHPQPASAGGLRG